MAELRGGRSGSSLGSSPCDGHRVILPVAAVMTRDDVIAIIQEFVFDWAETGNTDQIPVDKLANV